MKANEDKRNKISETERTQVRVRTNARIAHACSFLALIIILIDLAAFAIGQADKFYTTAGIMIAIALLAIAMLNNPTTLASKKQDDVPDPAAPDPANNSVEPTDASAEAPAGDHIDSPTENPIEPTVKK